MAALLVLSLVIPTVFTRGDALYPLSGDAQTYHTLATRLATWMGSPGAWVAVVTGRLNPTQKETYGLTDWVFQQLPAYMFTLGAAYTVFGSQPLTGRLVSAVLFALAAALLVIWTRRHFGLPAALLAGAAFSFWPANLYYGAAIMTELPVTFFVMLSICVLEATRHRKPVLVGLGGVMLGMMAYAKITLLYAPAGLVLVDAFLFRRRGSGLRPTLRFAGLRLAGVVAVILLWRGFLTAAQVPYFPYADKGERELWLYRGSVLIDRGFETLGPGTAISPLMMDIRDQDPGMGKAEGYWRCFKYVVTHEPKKWVALVCAKLGWFFRIPPGGGIDIPFWLGSLPPPWKVQGILLGLAMVGLILATVHRPQTLLWAVPVFWMAGIHAVVHLVARYNIPSLALLTPFAAFGAVRIAHRLVPPSRLRGVPGALAAGFRGAVWWQRAVCVLVFPVIPALALWGNGASDPDADEFATRLSKTGDAVVQRVQITETKEWSAYESVEIVIDMLPSVDLDADLALYVNGHQAHIYRGQPDNPLETFTVDPAVYPGRSDRLREDMERHINGFVKRRYPDLGFNYYRQWYRVAIPPEWLGDGRVEMKLVMESHRRGYLDVYGDRHPEFDDQGRLQVAMPGFMENAYQVSNYQFRMFNLQRTWADPRLIRPFTLTSRHLGACRISAGETPVLEPLKPPVFRLRIRAKFPGQLVLHRQKSGSYVYRRVMRLGPTDVALTPYQQQSFMRQRAQAATGWVVW